MFQANSCRDEMDVSRHISQWIQTYELAFGKSFLTVVSAETGQEKENED